MTRVKLCAFRAPSQRRGKALTWLGFASQPSP
jgi:hypothetical protein